MGFIDKLKAAKLKNDFINLAPCPACGQSSLANTKLFCPSCKNLFHRDCAIIAMRARGKVTHSLTKPECPICPGVKGLPPQKIFEYHPI